MKVRESWTWHAALLATRGVPDAKLEAEVLLRHGLEIDRAAFFASLEGPIAAVIEKDVSRAVRERLEGLPLAYIVGLREFYGLDFVVNPQVLVPRQETELLVDVALEVCGSLGDSRPVRIVDVGTGSGAIAIAVAKQCPKAVVYATDVSSEALRVADVNRHRHGVRDRVHLLKADLLEPFGSSVDIIVSNPPYIRTVDMQSLAPEVRREPGIALDGGPDGLNVTRRLLEQSPGVLQPGGSVLVEISPESADAVEALASGAFLGVPVDTTNDLLGLPRVVTVNPTKGSRSGLLVKDPATDAVLSRGK